MGWLRSKKIEIAVGCLALIALAGYGLISMRNPVERDFQAVRAQEESKASQPESSSDVVPERKGITAQEPKQADAFAEKTKQENTHTAERLGRELAAKADATAVKQLHEEATTRLAEVQHDATTRQDLANRKQELTGPASEISHSETVLASVSAVGAVEVRGIPIKQDATIFSGDRLRVGEKAYAKLSFTAGHKIELAEKTEVTVTNTQNGIQLDLNSGTLGFATSNGGSFTVTAGTVEMTASDTAAGDIAFLGADSIGVRVINGSVLLRNIKTRESWMVAAGQERLLSTGTSQPVEPLPQVASHIPPPLPIVPQSQPPQGISSQSSSTPRWQRGLLWLFGGAFGSALFLSNDQARSSSSSAPSAARVAAALSVARQAETTAVQLVGIGNQVQAAIALSQNVPTPIRTDLMSKVRTMVDQAQTSQQRIESLLAQLQQLQDRQRAPQGAFASNEVSADAASIETEIDSVIAMLNEEIRQLNELIVQLNNLIVTAANQGVTNIPNVNLQTVPTLPSPSRSQP